MVFCNDCFSFPRLILFLIFLKSLCTVFLSIAPIYMCTRVLFSSHSQQNLLFVVFLIVTILTGVILISLGLWLGISDD